jgi:hypothetical protein
LITYQEIYSLVVLYQTFIFIIFKEKINSI